ncbi:MAG TPA: HAD family phosphatase [Bacteroidia bacterium]|nr:HAD family phosphatase [Bacteroidia bacterium]
MGKIQAVIFDLGGVILDIDYKRTESAFLDLGVGNFGELFSQLRQDRLFDDFETGRIDPENFRERLRSIAGLPITDKQIDRAWNAILIGLPKQNVDFLFALREKNYRLFLLSNTNAIHEQAFRKMISDLYGEFIFDRIFEKMYLSHHVHLRKPDVAVYNLVLLENDLNPASTLFVDDSFQNIEGAKKAGLHSFWLEKGKNIHDLSEIFTG